MATIIFILHFDDCEVISGITQFTWQSNLEGPVFVGKGSVVTHDTALKKLSQGSSFFCWRPNCISFHQKKNYTFFDFWVNWPFSSIFRDATCRYIKSVAYIATSQWTVRVKTTWSNLKKGSVIFSFSVTHNKDMTVNLQPPLSQWMKHSNWKAADSYLLMRQDEIEAT